MWVKAVVPMVKDVLVLLCGYASTKQTKWRVDIRIRRMQDKEVEGGSRRCIVHDATRFVHTVLFQTCKLCLLLLVFISHRPAVAAALGSSRPIPAFLTQLESPLRASWNRDSSQQNYRTNCARTMISNRRLPFPPVSPPSFSRLGGGLRLRMQLDRVPQDYLDPIPNQPLKSNDPEKDFELNRGLAIDTLLQDYPYLFTKAPDFSIYIRNVVLQDAQGFSISGLRSYQLFFSIIRQMGALFRSVQVFVILSDKYATDKSRIRLRWKVVLNERTGPIDSGDRKSLLRKMGFQGNSFDEATSKDATYVEGISVYKLDEKGMITSHTIQVTEPWMLSPLSALNQLIPVNNLLSPDVGTGTYGHEPAGM